jgi:SAM-dependent methyltransferase
MLRSLGISARSDRGAYLLNQLDRTLLKNDGRFLPRTRELIDKLAAFSPFHADTSVLCVGCRNTNEINYFRSKGAIRVVGIDLFSSDPDIVVMDMHDLKFHNGEFAVVFACHSLEHSNNPQRAARELSRVCRADGWIVVEVPVNYVVTEADLVDFGSVEGVAALFQPHGLQLHWGETVPPPSGTKRASIARVFLKKTRAT